MSILRRLILNFTYLEKVPLHQPSPSCLAGELGCSQKILVCDSNTPVSPFDVGSYYVMKGEHTLAVHTL
jgi:hypothetical protein